MEIWQDGEFVCCIMKNMDCGHMIILEEFIVISQKQIVLNKSYI